MTLVIHACPHLLVLDTRPDEFGYLYRTSVAAVDDTTPTLIVVVDDSEANIVLIFINLSFIVQVTMRKTLTSNNIPTRARVASIATVNGVPNSTPRGKEQPKVVLTPIATAAGGGGKRSDSETCPSASGQVCGSLVMLSYMLFPFPEAPQTMVGPLALWKLTPDNGILIPRKDDCERVQHVVSQQSGTLVVHGPRGSGKTGVLQMALNTCKLTELPIAKVTAQGTPLGKVYILDEAVESSDRIEGSMRDFCERLANRQKLRPNVHVLVLSVCENSLSSEQLKGLLLECKTWQRAYPFLRIVIDLNMESLPEFLEQSSLDFVPICIGDLSKQEAKAYLREVVSNSPLGKTLGSRKLHQLVNLALEQEVGPKYTMRSLVAAGRKLSVAKTYEDALK